MMPTEIDDRETWNRLVLGFPDADVRQSYEWGELLAGQGWQPRRIAVFLERECVACMTILARRLPGVTRTVLCSPRGPLLDARNPEAWSVLLDAIRCLADETRAIFLRVSPNVPDHDAVAKSVLSRFGFVQTRLEWAVHHPPRATMLLDISGTQADVLARMHSKFRHRLQRAKQLGVEPVPASTADSVMEFRRDFLVPFASRKGFPVRAPRYYLDLWRLFPPPAGRLVFWHRDGRRLAADFTVRFGDHAHALYFADHPAARHLDIHRLSDWAMIIWARDAGCRSIGYGAAGTPLPPVPSNPGYGVYRYKHDLGCRVFYSVGYHDLVFVPTLYRLARACEALLPRLWRVRARFNRRE